MQLNKAKWVVITVACCFAILQALQPFLHAHLDGEHHSHGEGFHTVQSHESAHAVEHLSDHAIAAADHVTHTIAVPSAIKQDNPADQMLDVIVFALVCFWFALVMVTGSNRIPPFIILPGDALARRLAAPRAPPLF